MTRRSFFGVLAAAVLSRRAPQPFTSGRLGRQGKWFGDFGSDLVAALHGRVVILTPEQEKAFLRAKQ